jgi:hypothetical protein
LRDLDAILTHRIRAESTIKFYRRAMVHAVVIVERLSIAYPRVFQGVQLEGWHDNFFLQIDDFDNLLYEVYDQYGDQGPQNPLVQLAMQIISHGAMYHLTKSMLQRHAGGANPPPTLQPQHQEAQPQRPMQSRPPPPPPQQQARRMPTGPMPPLDISNLQPTIGELRQQRDELQRQQRESRQPSAMPPNNNAVSPTHARTVDPPVEVAQPVARPSMHVPITSSMGPTLRLRPPTG